MQSLPIFHAHPLLGPISGSQGHQENKHITNTTKNPLSHRLIFEKRFWEVQRDQHNQDEVNEVRGCKAQSDLAPVVKSPGHKRCFPEGIDTRSGKGNGEEK